MRLGDFGVAEQLSTLTRNKATIGTPYWMAPEVVLRPRDSPTAVVHEKSDVWSLGITAIEMAEILPPHASSLSPVRVLKAIAEGPPPTFSWSEPSALLRSFATACLAKELSKRPTAEECLQHEFLHCMRPARVARGACMCGARERARASASEREAPGPAGARDPGRRDLVSSGTGRAPVGAAAAARSRAGAALGPGCRCPRMYARASRGGTA